MKNIQSKAISFIAALFLGFLSPGCGGGGADKQATPKGSTVVSGIAASGAPMVGNVFLKDSANNPEMSTALSSGGAFSFDVSGKTGPFMLRGGTLYSMSAGAGTANINPLSNLMVAEMGGFTNMAEMNSFYANPDGTKMRSMMDSMGTASQNLRQMMAPLLTAYGVTDGDPITGPYAIGQGMDRMFDDVKMTVDSDGTVTMMYANGTPVFSGHMGNIMAGTMMSGNIMSNPPNSGSGIVIQPRMASLQVNAKQQFTANIPVTWSVETASGGSITSEGLYSAPAVQGVFLVKATSVAEPAKSAMVTINVGSMGMNMGM